jgi:hypothetical protein
MDRAYPDAGDPVTTDDARLQELTRALLDLIHDIRDHLAGPPAPDAEVRSWPLCAPEHEFGGGIWCADDDCPLQAESSEIGYFREGTFTLDQLHEAIGFHIAARREWEEDQE